VAAIFWAYLLLLVVARVARRGGLELGEGLLVIGLGLFAAYSLRQIPWFLLATAPLLAEDLDALFVARPRVGRAVGQVAGPLGDGRAPIVLALAVAAVVVLQPIRPALPEAIGRVTLNEPVEIADRLARVLPADARKLILNEQVWGGYLSYRLGGRVQTAMDGRLEIRDRATWAWYFGLMHGDGDPAAELDARGVNWAALSPERQSLRSKLLDAGWQIEIERPDGVLLHLADASTS
jgi:hypothetical protein